MAAVEDSFYKIAAEGLRVSQCFIISLRVEFSNSSNQYIEQIFNTIFEKLKVADIDQVALIKFFKFILGSQRENNYLNGSFTFEFFIFAGF